MGWEDMESRSTAAGQMLGKVTGGRRKMTLRGEQEGQVGTGGPSLQVLRRRKAFPVSLSLPGTELLQTGLRECAF